MAPQRKKQSRAERLEKKRLAERERKKRIRSDPMLYAELKEKDRQRYIRLKEEGKIIPLAEMTPRTRRNRQKRNRINFKRFYDRKKVRLARIPEEDPLSVTTRPHNSLPPPAENIQPEPEVNADAHCLRSRLTSSPSRDPCSLLSSPCVSSIPSPSSEYPNSPGSDILVKSDVSLRTKFKRYQMQKAKELLALRKKIIQLNKDKERYRKQLQRYINKPETKTIFPSNKKKSPMPVAVSKAIDKRLRNLVKEFYEDDDNSRQCPGKRDCITKNGLKMQKRYLTDSIKNLHKKYLNTGNKPISYVTFSRLRPFWVIKPDVRSRNTCACKIHFNMELLVNALKKNKLINENTTTDLVRALCCNQVSVKCLLRQCQGCKTKSLNYLEFNNDNCVVYWAWEKDTKTYIKDDVERKTNIIKKVKHLVAPKTLIEKTESEVIPFLKHCGYIKNQYDTLTVLKQNLRLKEFIIHIDFSENYNSKYHAEIQSVHFGANRSQLTLHTSMIYYKSENGTLNSQAVCTVSQCLRHDAAAVWAHLVPILREIENLAPHMNKLTIVSDSPTGQYRNKKIFYVMSQLVSYCSDLTRVMWHYCECGHGKGAPDGIGGILKRTADDRVAYGDDITDLESLVTCLKKYVKGVHIHVVEDYEIVEKDWLIPTDLQVFSGTFKVHQVLWTKKSKNRLALRSLSCITPECLDDVIECPHGLHLGFYELGENQNQTFANTQGEPSRDYCQALQKSPQMNAKKPQILEIRRFKACNKHFLKQNNQEPVPSTSRTHVESQTPITDDEDVIDVNWGNNTPSVSFFDGLNSDVINQYERNVDALKKKSIYNKKTEDFYVDSDSDESLNIFSF